MNERARGFWAISFFTVVVSTAACATTSGTAARTEPAREPKETEQSAALPASSTRGEDDPQPASRARSKQAVLRFEVSNDNFPLPLVDTVIGGQPTTMIVDTGATHVVVGSWVAIELPKVDDSASKVETQALDHAGKSVPLARLKEETLSVSGWGPTPVSPIYVFNMPRALEDMGIGGIVSPQALVRQGRSVVLDLRRASLRETSWDDGLATIASERGESISGPMRVCTSDGGTLPIIRVKIDGVEVDAQIDTGATSSSVRAGTEIGKRLAPKAKLKGEALVGSGKMTVHSTPPVPVEIGGLRVETSIDVVSRSEQACTNDVLLGMDVLAKCVFVLGKDRVEGKCGG